MLITEIKNNPICLTDKKGGTIRLLPRESRKISKELISNEINIAVSKGLIVLSNIDEKPSKKGGDK